MCRRAQISGSSPEIFLEVLNFVGCHVWCVSGIEWQRRKVSSHHIISSLIAMPFPPIYLPDHNAMPSIAYGTGSVNKGKDIHDYVENALEQGFEHIDTAQSIWRRLILVFEIGL